MLPAYCHEWRREPPNDAVMARYESCRIRAIRINFCRYDVDLIRLETSLWNLPDNPHTADSIADSIQSGLEQEQAKLEAEEIRHVLIDGNASRRDMPALLMNFFALA